MTSAFFEDNRKLLLDACGCHLDQLLLLFVTVDDDDKVLRDDICGSSSQSYFYFDDLLWRDFKVVGLNFDSWLAADFLSDGDVTCHTALVFEFNKLGLLLAHGNEL